MNHKQARDAARLKYKPGTVQLLLIAESPPADDSGRYFYYENVREKDSLFLETMRVLYPGHWTHCADVRARKPDFLKRFCNDGYYLIDSVDHPLGKISTPKKVRHINANIADLLQRVREVYSAEQTQIVLISKPVFASCAEILQQEGFRLLNTQMIDFPGPGRQLSFRRKFADALRSPDRQIVAVR